MAADNSRLSQADDSKYSVAAVVVTFNRKTLLIKCVDQLLSQSRPLDKIILVDNASTDGTQDLLQELGYLDRPEVEFLPLGENSGGAGGFHAGLNHAIRGNCDWFWLMDDDAFPRPNALEAILAVRPDKRNIYASSAVFSDSEGQETLCWPAVLDDVNEYGKRVVVHRHADLRDVEGVRAVPFLGFMINRDMIEKIGLPDKGFFISGDDIDYSERAKQAKAKIVLIKNSKLSHPCPVNYNVRLLGLTFFCLRLDPWRRYYDVRNRVFNARRYFGNRFWMETIPGLVIRLLATLWYEPHRLRQMRAYWKGVMDGLLGRKGKRIEPGSL
jgi:rhamnopyranosyl-N-acetylglucosaminyl-diphospho-decaprenol beta-1,3/1,4-galactofuranosyltransferase